MFVKYIQAETGARVQIKGRGSGFIENDTGRESDEAMHISIVAPTDDQIQRAKILADDLLMVLRIEYDKARGVYTGSGAGYDSYGGAAVQGAHGYVSPRRARATGEEEKPQQLRSSVSVADTHRTRPPPPSRPTRTRRPRPTTRPPRGPAPSSGRRTPPTGARTATTSTTRSVSTVPQLLLALSFKLTVPVQEWQRGQMAAAGQQAAA